MKILITESLNSQRTPQILNEAGFDVEVFKPYVLEQYPLEEWIKRTQPDILLIGLKWQITKELMELDPNLKMVATRTTNITDHIDIDYCKEKNIEIINLKGEELEDVWAVPELTIAMMIYIMRTLYVPGYELREKNLALIGFGRIGKMVAKLAKEFGMKVAYNDPAVGGSISLNELLSWADVVSLHASSIEENRGMLKYEHFEMMKRQPFFLNSSRPWMVDKNAFQESLENGKIKGAWSDFDTGFIHKNLIVTNHIGGKTYESLIKTELIMAQKVVDWIKNAQNKL